MRLDTLHRFSKSCNHAITQLGKLFENLRKFWTDERETRTTGTNFMYMSQVEKGFLVSHVLMLFLMHEFVRNCF